MDKKAAERVKTKLGKLGGYVIWFFVAILALSLVKNLNRVSRIRKQVEAEKASIEKMVRENTELNAQMARTVTADFLEKEVRNKLGLAKEGEAIVVLPDPEILKKLAPKITTEAATLPDPNWRRWLKLFI